MLPYGVDRLIEKHLEKNLNFDRVLLFFQMFGRTLLNKTFIQRGILPLVQAKNLSTSQVLDKNVAVILSGCGV